MQIVIEIDEDTYRYMQSRCKYQNKGDKGLSKFEEVGVAIKNGTPLPEGQGRLIILSEDAVKREQTPLRFSCQNWISEVGLSNATVAIIEADGGDAE